ncbi:MAG: DUF2892 domain-containing protein [Campylobacterales bacterium]|nr:DUF2892 domain-containing protein [Campylobacterales bacterium]
MDAKKVSKICRPFRIILGIILIAIGFYTGNAWFYLGIIPLIAGIINFCPLCGITKQCNLVGSKE